VVARSAAGTDPADDAVLDGDGEGGGGGHTANGLEEDPSGIDRGDGGGGGGGDGSGGGGGGGDTSSVESSHLRGGIVGAVHLENARWEKSIVKLIAKVKYFKLS